MVPSSLKNTLFKENLFPEQTYGRMKQVTRVFAPVITSISQNVENEMAESSEDCIIVESSCILNPVEPILTGEFQQVGLMPKGRGCKTRCIFHYR